MTRLPPVPPDGRLHVEYARTGSIERHPLERGPIVTAGLAKQVLRGRGAFDVVRDLGVDKLQSQSEYADWIEAGRPTCTKSFGNPPACQPPSIAPRNSSQVTPKSPRPLFAPFVSIDFCESSAPNSSDDPGRNRPGSTFSMWPANTIVRFEGG